MRKPADAAIAALTGIISAFVSGAAGGQPEIPQSADEARLLLVADRIIVEDRRGDYGIQSTNSATKTGTPLIDIPQSLSVIGADLIADQSSRSIGDLVRYAPGVTMGQGEGHRDQITIRGNNSTADFFTDSVRDDIQYYRPLYNIERVEILKGPNAMIFGRGGGGGVVNRVLKRPEAKGFAAGTAAVDSFGGWLGAADLNAALSDAAGARLNAVYEQGRNHRDFFELERYAANPTFSADLAADTWLGLSYEYDRDRRVVDRGAPSQNGEPLEGFDNAFFGARGVNLAGFEGHSASIDLKREFSERLTAKAKIVYGNFDKFYRNAFPATAVSVGAGGAEEVGVEAYFDATERRNFFVQGDVIGKFATGPAAHTILVGGEFGDQRTRNRRLNGFFDSGAVTTLAGRRTVVPLADPFFVPPITFQPGTGARAARSEADVLSAYIQDQAEIGRHLELIAGLRFDRFDLQIADLLTGVEFAREDEVLSPRIGAIFKPIPDASIYASFSRSFLPQSGDQFASLDVTLAALEPERFENLEVGAKWDISKRLSVTAAVYRLDRSNTRAPGPAAGTIVLTGEQRSRGLEIGVAGALTDRWKVIGGYTLQEAEIMETTSAAPAGRDVAQVPRHLFSLWNRYDVNDRLAFGAGVQHQSDSFASISNAVVLPSFTRVDAAVYLRLSDRVEAQVNVNNILDADYFPTAHNDNNIATGAPLSAVFTLKARI